MISESELFGCQIGQALTGREGRWTPVNADGLPVGGTLQGRIEEGRVVAVRLSVEGDISTLFGVMKQLLDLVTADPEWDIPERPRSSGATSTSIYRKGHGELRVRMRADPERPALSFELRRSETHHPTFEERREAVSRATASPSCTRFDDGA